MLRLMLLGAVLSTLAAAPAMPADPPAKQKKYPTHRHENFRVGAVGTWDPTEYAYTVVEVIDDKTLRMQIAIVPDVQVIVKGMPTKGIADGKKVVPPGAWEITGTQKHLGRTYYVIEPYKPKEEAAPKPAKPAKELTAEERAKRLEEIKTELAKAKAEQEDAQARLDKVAAGVEKVKKSKESFEVRRRRVNELLAERTSAEEAMAAAKERTDALLAERKQLDPEAK